MTWKNLIAESELSFGFINGQGIGSFLLAFVIIVFLIRRKISDTTLEYVSKFIIAYLLFIFITLWPFQPGAS